MSESTVRVTVSPAHFTSQILGRIEARGESVSDAVDHDIALAALIGMIAGRANCEVRIVELDIEKSKCVLYYEYNMASTFGMKSCSNGHDYSWLYTVELNPGDELSSLHTILDVVYSLGSTHRQICSHEVATMIAKAEASNDKWEIRNLRAALEYYAAYQAWKSTTLVSDYNDAILHGNPHRPAYDALVNLPVEPLPAAIQRVISNRPDYTPSWLK